MTMQESDDGIELGGNIQLVGFKELDSANMIVLKKIIGNYARKFSEVCERFEKLTVSMKHIHGEHGKYQIQVKLLDNGKPHNSEHIDHNLYVALDAALKKIEHMKKR